MLGSRLMRLIETHAEELAIGLTAKLRQSDLTSDFRKIAAEELQQTSVELYRNLSEWLLKKTEKDIEQRFVAIAQRRAASGVRLPQFVWAIGVSRTHLYEFLLGQTFADSFFGLYSALELKQMLNQFFERATYYAVAGYEEARERDRATATAATAPKIRRASRLRKVLFRV